MDNKEFWKSKTLWFNFVALLVMVLNPFGFLDFVPDEDLAEYAAAIITIINFVLRFVTTLPIKFQ